MTQLPAGQPGASGDARGACPLQKNCPPPLERGAAFWRMVKLMPLRPKTPSSSLASFISRLVLPFWYRFTKVVLEKSPLNACSSVFRWTVHSCKNVFHVFYILVTIFTFLTFIYFKKRFYFYFKKRCKVESGKQINKKHFQNNSNEIEWVHKWQNTVCSN